MAEVPKLEYDNMVVFYQNVLNGAKKVDDMLAEERRAEMLNAWREAQGKPLVEIEATKDKAIVVEFGTGGEVKEEKEVKAIFKKQGGLFE